MTAIRVRLLAEARSRWRSWAGVALIVGLTAGAVIAAVAGARRTGSAYDRFLHDHRAFDIAVGANAPPNEGAAALDAVERMPQVAASARVRTFPYASKPGGDANDVDYDTSLIASVDGRLGTEINRFKLLAGRAADPAAPQEIVVGRAVAEAKGLEAGSALDLGFCQAGCGANP